MSKLSEPNIRESRSSMFSTSWQCENLGAIVWRPGKARSFAEVFSILPRFWHVGDVGMLLHACVNPMPDLRMLVKFLPDVVWRDWMCAVCVCVLRVFVFWLGVGGRECRGTHTHIPYMHACIHMCIKLLDITYYLLCINDCTLYLTYSRRTLCTLWIYVCMYMRTYGMRNLEYRVLWAECILHIVTCTM